MTLRLGGKFGHPSNVHTEQRSARKNDENFHSAKKKKETCPTPLAKTTPNNTQPEHTP